MTIGGGDAGEAGNVFANMTSYGVSLASSTRYVEISHNSFYNNGDNALDDALFLNGGNFNYTRPNISAGSTSTVTVDGVDSGNIVEVYIADFGGTEYGEGYTFIGSAVAAGTSVDVPVSGVNSGQWVTVIRTLVGGSGNLSSPFSTNVQVP